MFSRGKDVSSGSFDGADSDSIQRTASSSSLALSSNFGGKTKDQLITMLKVRKSAVYSGWDHTQRRTPRMSLAFVLQSLEDKLHRSDAAKGILANELLEARLVK